MKANAKIRNIQDLMVSILTLVFFCFCWQNLILFTLSGLARSVCVKLDKYLIDVHRRSIAAKLQF